MTETAAPAHVPSERQLVLFRAIEELHELTRATTVLLVDGDGASVAVAGDENDVAPPLRAAIGGKRLRAAGSVRALLEDVDLEGSPVNVSIYAVGESHALAILFDAEADLVTVQRVGKEAATMFGEILAEE